MRDLKTYFSNVFLRKHPQNILEIFYSQKVFKKNCKIYTYVFNGSQNITRIFSSITYLFLTLYIKIFFSYTYKNIFNKIFSNKKYYFKNIPNAFLKCPQNIFRHVTEVSRKYFSLSVINLFAIRDTSVSDLQSFRMNLAVSEIRHLAVFVGEFAFANTPGKNEINDDGSHEAQVN